MQIDALRPATTLLFSATICGAPAFAQSHGNQLAAHSVTADHLVLLAGDCPQKGENTARWINLRGRHALSVSTDGTDWVGFEVFVDNTQIAHHRLPTALRTMPQGTVQFTVSNPSTSPFFIGIFNFTGTCDSLDQTVPATNGIVQIPVGPDTVGAYAYVFNTGPSSAIFSNFLFNGRPIPRSPLKDQSEQFPFNFCSDAENCEK
jgi:hypothetical protein